MFTIGDDVLAYFDSLLYYARIKKRRLMANGMVQYYVHYAGFKTRYDEWVTENDVLVINSINIDHKQRLETNR